MTEFSGLQFVPFPETLQQPDLNMTYRADGTSPITVAVDNGLAHVVTTRDFPIYRYEIQWTTDPSSQTQLSEWYRTTLNNGALPFMCPLLIDGTIRELQCIQLEPQTLSLIHI